MLSGRRAGYMHPVILPLLCAIGTGERIPVDGPAVYTVPPEWRDMLKPDGTQLGSGGNAVVYKVETKCKDESSSVAVKRLSYSVQTRSNCVKFFTEALVQDMVAELGMAPLVFHTIPASREECESYESKRDPTLHISMEKAHGSLDDLIKLMKDTKNESDPNDACDSTASKYERLAAVVVASILKGYEVMHENGLLHTDVKPANIFIFVRDAPETFNMKKDLLQACLNGKCRYVLADFGAACKRLSGPPPKLDVDIRPCSNMKAGYLGGTRMFWPPEIQAKLIESPGFAKLSKLKRKQVKPKHEWDKEMDYFALAQIVWMLITDRHIAFPTLDEMMLQGRYEPPTPSGFSDRAQNILKLLFAKDPIERRNNGDEAKNEAFAWLKELNVALDNVNDYSKLPCVGNCAVQHCSTFALSDTGKRCATFKMDNDHIDLKCVENSESVEGEVLLLDDSSEEDNSASSDDDVD
eukprot:TRINITY_DN25523_c0_g2_i1.p1 TRINITY_DN25523_c0_g2~~TRINITY_DN25523_c0_g2_i1.p1  ORF type:complete len:486 (-),score=78.61 TRINITY_DN25523_c0_g2_i1:121-1521(-)